MATLLWLIGLKWLTAGLAGGGLKVKAPRSSGKPCADLASAAVVLAVLKRACHDQSLGSGISDVFYST